MEEISRDDKILRKTFRYNSWRRLILSSNKESRSKKLEINIAPSSGREITFGGKEIGLEEKKWVKGPKMFI